MNEQRKTKAQLIKELEQTRGRIAELVRKRADEGLHDLIEIIQFTEHVSTKIHGLVNEAEIYRTVREEFAQLKRYVASILLFTDDGSSLRIAEVSLSPAKVKAGEKATGLRLKGYKIDLKKSSTYRQVVREGKTVQVSVSDITGELFPRPLARLILKALGIEKESSILTPLKRHGKIVGAFAMTAPELAEHFIPSVKNLAQHISIALEWADENTDRKMAEEALRESEGKYRSLVESTDDAVHLISRDMRYEFANGKYLSRLGLSLTELVGQEYGKLHPWDTNDEFAKKVDQVIKSGKPMTYDYLSHRDNKYFMRTLSPVTGEKPGEIKAITVTSKDITELKQAEEALRESEEKYRQIVELSPDSIAVHREGKIVFINTAGARQLGAADPEQLIGKPIMDFLHPDYHDIVKERIRRITKGKKEVPLIEEKIIRLDGTVIDVDVAVTPATYQGKPAVQAIARDITERKRAEKELSESREQLRSLSAHLQSVREESQKLLAREIHDELGQDLTALKMDLSWLKGRLRPDQKLLQEKGAAMTELSDAMIKTVKRITARLRPALLDDLGVAAALEWELEEFAKRTGIGCDLTVEPEEIDLDPDRATAVYRIFQEALMNIARHAQATEVKVSLKVHAGMLEMEIRDNGIGIKEEQIASPRSFGLIGIRERVLQWNGEARIEGVEGKGTTISITLPIAEGEHHHD